MKEAGVWFLMILTGVALYLCWVMVAPFVSAITLAFALCVVMNPVRRQLISKWPKTLVALLMLVVVVAILALSLYVISQRLIQEAARARQLLEGGWMVSVLSWAQSQFNLESIAKEGWTTVAKSLVPAFGKSAVGLARAFLSLLFFFFFVRDEEKLIEGVRRLLPLTPSE